MIGLRLTVLAVAWLWATSGIAQDEPAPIESRYTHLSACQVLEQGGAGEDWVSHRCQGYGSIPVWLHYTDSARAWVGFGAKRNVSGMFSAHRDETWPLEWRGLATGGSFEPFAVILRVRSADGAPGSHLVVYRLRDDGSACIIGSTTASNESARSIADASRIRFSCQQEPRLL